MSYRKQAGAIASLNLGLTVAVLAATGCALVIFGCVFEARWQLDLMHAGGRAALDAYTDRVASHQLSFAAFLVESVTGRCYARSALLQGVGFWFIFVIAPVVAGFVGFVRWASARERRAYQQLRLAVAH
ncbi:hypothetical protein [Paraburkholderia sp. BL10I2N1]|uniref:hypothetical protein n=1 Tax=Paraburkholderia sp. BL10I2N1 TaxID=1938796 RepID=UPI00105CEA23|nr:hypothetical protein [Paraburkholderia sp. BL10I2N1]TDN59047.1 hypothetical protein B0G77_8233 [Paraburkholderia sp. BL10I2N1]